MVPAAAQLFKNRLQEYAQKNSLPLPVYDTINEGKDHLPQFKCTVTINDAKYESSPGFNNKKAAQNAAAKAAVEDLEMQGLLGQFKEKIRPKNVLAELASRKNMSPPTYRFTMTFTATVEINGVSYTGGPAINKKEATNKAALEAVQAIDPKYCNSLLHGELNVNNNSEHPTAECDANMFESAIPADNLTSDNQLLGGTESQSAGNVLEKLNVDGTAALEKGSGKTGVENPRAVGQGLEYPKVKDAHEAEKGMPNINDAHSVPVEQPLNQPRQDPMSAQQGHLKKEAEDVYLDKEHGFEERQQICEELDLTESLSKRSISESENAEQMSRRSKKKRRETDGTV